MGPAASRGFCICSGKSSRYLLVTALPVGRVGEAISRPRDPGGPAVHGPLACLPRRGQAAVAWGCSLGKRGLQWVLEGVCSQSLPVLFGFRSLATREARALQRASFRFCRSFAIKEKRGCAALIIFFPLINSHTISFPLKERTLAPC